VPSDRSSLVLIYSLASAIDFLAFLIIWARRRQAASARPLGLMVLAAAFWALCDAVELSVNTVEAKRLVSQVQYLSVTSMVPLFFHSVLALSRQERFLTRPVLWAVWGIPAATLAIAWTSPWHGWLWKGILIPDPASNLGVYIYGWWFWILTAHNYIVMLVGTVLVLRATQRVSSHFRGAMWLLMVAVLLPWLGNIAYVFKLGPWPGLNWLSISVGISGILMAWVTLHGGLLDLLPTAREALIQLMADGVLVLEDGGRILHLNSAAVEILGIDGARPSVPSAVQQAVAQHREEEWRQEIVQGTGAATQWLDLRATAIPDRWGDRAGQLLVVRDITSRKALEAEKAELITKLQTAVDEVRALRGLLPICAACKKVRDDRGYWNQIEGYFLEHTNVRFTHGICPECVQKLYPEFSTRRVQGQG
jgi:PAS domain-containing protein